MKLFISLVVFIMATTAMAASKIQLLSSEKFDQLTFTKRSAYVNALKSAMYLFEQERQKVFLLTRIDQNENKNLFMSQAVAGDEGAVCVIGGRELKVVNNLCPTKASPCHTEEISDGFECGQIHGGVCVNREPIKGISEACYAQSRLDSKLLQKEDYEKFKSDYEKLYASACGSSSVVNQVGCDFLAKSIEKSTGKAVTQTENKNSKSETEKPNVGTSSGAGAESSSDSKSKVNCNKEIKRIIQFDFDSNESDLKLLIDEKVRMGSLKKVLEERCSPAKLSKLPEATQPKELCDAILKNPTLRKLEDILSVQSTGGKTLAQAAKREATCLASNNKKPIGKDCEQAGVLLDSFGKLKIDSKGGILEDLNDEILRIRQNNSKFIDSLKKSVLREFKNEKEVDELLGGRKEVSLILPNTKNETSKTSISDLRYKATGENERLIAANIAEYLETLTNVSNWTVSLFGMSLLKGQLADFEENGEFAKCKNALYKNPKFLDLFEKRKAFADKFFEAPKAAPAPSSPAASSPPASSPAPAASASPAASGGAK